VPRPWVAARLRDDDAAVRMADENGGTLLRGQHALGHGDVIRQRGGRILDDRYPVAVCGLCALPLSRSEGQPSSVNDHQKTVSGKKQHGPDDKVGRDAGGNEGSKGQNVDARRSGGAGKQPGDIGDERGRSRMKH
jgi:hypothetical protein